MFREEEVEVKGVACFAERELALGEVVQPSVPGVLVVDAGNLDVCSFCCSPASADGGLKECSSCRSVALCKRCGDVDRVRRVHANECAALRELAHGSWESRRLNEDAAEAELAAAPTRTEVC